MGGARAPPRPQATLLLTVLRRSELRVCVAHLRVIAHANNKARFEEVLQRRRALATPCPI